MKRALAIIANCATIGAGATVLAPGVGASTPARAGGGEIGVSGHSPGKPINSRRCRKLIRKINKADRRGKDRRVRRLSRKYNRTCRR